MSDTSARFQRCREARCAQLGVERVLEQFDYLGRPRAAAVLLPCPAKDLLRQARNLQRHTQIPPKLISKPQILTRKVHGESNVVAPIEDQLRLGLMNEAVARARLDGRKGLRQIQPCSLREHQRLACGNEVDECQHVGDDLQYTRFAEGAY